MAHQHFAEQADAVGDQRAAIEVARAVIVVEALQILLGLLAGPYRGGVVDRQGGIDCGPFADLEGWAGHRSAAGNGNRYTQQVRDKTRFLHAHSYLRSCCLLLSLRVAAGDPAAGIEVARCGSGRQQRAQVVLGDLVGRVQGSASKKRTGRGTL